MRMKPRLSRCSSFVHGVPLLLLFLLPLLCHSWRAAAQAPQTDPVETAAVNAILSKLGLSAPPSWNISGNPCSGAATDDTSLDDNPAFNPAIKCDCSDQNNTVCHVIRLKINMLDAVGPIPEELRNLTHLKKLDFRRNYFTGPLPAFIGELTALEYMTVGINALSGPLPKELGNLTNLKSLALGSNHFNGSLPDELGKLTKLQQMYIDSNDFSGPLPSTLSQLKNLSVLFRSLYIQAFILQSIEELQDIRHNCINGLLTVWDFKFIGSEFQQYHRRNTSINFESSITEFLCSAMGIGTVFSGILPVFLVLLNPPPLRWTVVGERKEQNFDIRKTAGGKSFTVVKKQYNVSVIKNFLEVHLFWAGKELYTIVGRPNVFSYSEIKEKEGLILDWPARFEICLGIARGIAYLHEESSIRIVHRDIKASNVLLDTDLNPKISDFGLAKLCDDKRTHVSTRVAGTFGYLAPEYAMRGHMTEKVDVFSFGVVASELVAGESNYQNSLEEDTTYIFERVWELYENKRALDIVDPKLTEFNGDEVLRVIRVALHCTQISPQKRPPMSKVVSMLAGDADVTEEIAKPSYITEWQVKARQRHRQLHEHPGRLVVVAAIVQRPRRRPGEPGARRGHAGGPVADVHFHHQ
ncbi:hypothetical protein PR202_ga19049 [Eleusine coracana subsp. coracana]|uniref:Protein kinase domain-containing protein n=1 Tax=Eleusine coracana subsp. coracana TaxID=191504 RepID=A0AAV5CTH0_ELECO|nr:hypothetical protein PR202_ga19049 [Eleusine coracana subsp. coracana]